MQFLNFSSIANPTKSAELKCSKVKHSSGIVTGEWKIAKTGEPMRGCKEGKIFCLHLRKQREYVFIKYFSYRLLGC